MKHCNRRIRIEVLERKRKDRRANMPEVAERMEGTARAEAGSGRMNTNISHDREGRRQNLVGDRTSE